MKETSEGARVAVAMLQNEKQVGEWHWACDVSLGS